MSDAPATIMTRLRDETRDLHASAEGKAFQRRMLSGELSREEYVRWLGQMLQVHRALEEPLRRLWQSDPAFAALREEQFQEPYLLADLAALHGASGGHAPLPATLALIADIECAARETPLALLGYHYVLEGSNNGNRFIARRLVPALGLAHGAGDRYLDPYGEAQPALWARFKQDMETIGFAGPQADLLVAAARRMFAGIGAISDELDPAGQSGQTGAPGPRPT